MTMDCHVVMIGGISTVLVMTMLSKDKVIVDHVTVLHCYQLWKVELELNPIIDNNLFYQIIM